MHYANFNATQRKLMNMLLRAYFDDRLEDIDRIPLELRPKGSDHVRCCIYRDRAVLRYRCMAILGFSIEAEEDELIRLSDYARMAKERTRINAPMLTVLNEACNGCVRSRYEVTNACHGCIARPCEDVCPKDAISVKGRSRIDAAKCIGCGKCEDACPYHAIIRIPIPCEESCPTGAIVKSDTGKEYIDYSKCIFCGKCMVACPFCAIMERSQLIDVFERVRQGRRVVGMVAPAIAGQFQCSIGQLATAMKQAGFAEVVEVAHGADITAVKEADEFVERMEEGQPFMTSSCCPAYTELVHKYIPELEPFVSHTRTPMHYTAAEIRERDPEAITVFVGPCVAKRKEAIADPAVDYVLTFEEVEAALIAKDIDLASCEESEMPDISFKEGRGFPISGGVTNAVKKLIGERAEIRPVSVDGLNKKSMRMLKQYATKSCPGNFVEVMGCTGGCVSGPAVIETSRKATRRIDSFVDDSPSLIDESH